MPMPTIACLLSRTPIPHKCLICTPITNSDLFVMFVHHVFFWLKEGLSEADVQQFETGVRSLLTIPSVKFGDVGKPASTDRPIIERSYSYSLLVVFDNEEGHDAYQVPQSEIHRKFVDECQHLWDRVLIYDSVS